MLYRKGDDLLHQQIDDEVCTSREIQPDEMGFIGNVHFFPVQLY